VLAELKELGRRAAAAASGAVCAASLLLAPVPAAAAAALTVEDVAALTQQQAEQAQQQQQQPTTVIRLPASEDPAILTAQQTMVQAWSIVGESFFDASFGGADWTDELRRHMLAAYASPDAAAAYGEIGAMLKDLHDPYTRLLPPDEYADFMVASNGEMQGVGMLIANEPVDGHLLVLAPIKGSPADRAGVRPGDILTAINGEDTAGWTGEQAAHHLRGKGGTSVRVRLVRHSADAIPGVPGRPPPLQGALFRGGAGKGSSKGGGSTASEVVVEVSLTRETVSLSPLMYGEVPGPRGARLGYLKLASFSQNAGAAVRDAIRELQGRGVDGFVLDLRANPGGLVQSAADVARVFLGGHPTLFSVSGRSDEQLQEIALEDGRPETTAPLAVLVDRGSASASEILSGALHDNRRAVVVGDDRTYGARARGWGWGLVWVGRWRTTMKATGQQCQRPTQLTCNTNNNTNTTCTQPQARAASSRCLSSTTARRSL
jgi:C-terminal processing protease CtpA/Prc